MTARHEEPLLLAEKRNSTVAVSRIDVERAREVLAGTAAESVEVHVGDSQVVS